MLEAKAGNPQLLVDSGDYLEVTIYVDGAAADATGTPTVTITKDDGSAVVTAQNATKPASTTGIYRYSLTPAQLADLDILTATWSATVSGSAVTLVTHHEIVGGFYVSLADLRAMASLSDTSKFTVPKLVEARKWFETKFEEYTGQAFVPRYKKHRVTGTGTTTMLLDPNIRTVRSVRDYTDATTYTAYTASELADINIDPIGTLTRLTLGSWRAGSRNLEFVYEHGMTVCPDDVREAAQDAIRMKLLDDQTGRREYSVQTDVGIVRFSRPGPGRPFGIEDVDEVANRYRLIPVA